MRAIEAQLQHKIASLDLRQVDWCQFLPNTNDGRISKGTFLKPYVSPRERGVVFISFEDQWVRLLHARNLEAFAQRYTLVVAPTWCPPHSVVNLLFPIAYPDVIHTLISNTKDIELFPRLSSRYVVVPLYASSWVDPACYQPLPRNQRDIDIVMIANFGKYKRHHVLFRALRSMPPQARATLIGQPQDGRDAETIRSEARAFGVEDRISVYTRVTNQFLANALSRAKVSLILSRREGSCVAVAESLFADTPVGMLDGAQVGSSAFINNATGRLLREGHLPSDLNAFLRDAAGYHPRQWALQHISCHRSTRVLNDVLRERALASGQQWTQDIATQYWRPDPQVKGSTASKVWIERERAYVREHHGIDIGTDPNVVTPAFDPLPQPASPLVATPIPVRA
jgi:glycosyltransferase involved in cell wall biosynthesis